MRQLTCVVFVLSVTVGGLVASSAALAAPVVATAVHGPFDPSTLTDEVFFAADVSSSDLLHGIAGTGGTWTEAFGSSPDGFNDAIHGGDFDDVGNPAALTGAAWAKDGDNISFREFDLGFGSGAGFDITEIQSIAAWQGAGFSNQKYDVSVRYVGDAMFTALASVDYQPFSAALTEGGSTKVNITDDDTGTLASGIEAIRFDILDTTSNGGGGTVFREIDVFGIETEGFHVADFDMDGDIDGADWNVYVSFLFSDTSGLATDAEKIASGDFNLDGANNHDDFVAFRTAYDWDNGLGTFAAMIGSTAVPEPSSILLLAVGAVGLGLRRRKRT